MKLKDNQIFNQQDNNDQELFNYSKIIESQKIEIKSQKLEIEQIKTKIETLTKESLAKSEKINQIENEQSCLNNKKEVCKYEKNSI